MITPKLERAGQVEVPFQGSFFLGDDFPMALPWAKREVPLAGRPIAHDPGNLHMWYDAKLCRQHGQFACPVDAGKTRPEQSGRADGGSAVRVIAFLRRLARVGSARETRVGAPQEAPPWGLITTFPRALAPLAPAEAALVRLFSAKTISAEPRSSNRTVCGYDFCRANR
jgi:hypothetical protein